MSKLVSIFKCSGNILECAFVCARELVYVYVTESDCFCTSSLNLDLRIRFKCKAQDSQPDT